MPEHAGNRQKIGLRLYLLVAACILFIDQFTKYESLLRLETGDSFPVIKNIFHITLVLNKGIAFGLFSGSLYISAAIGIFVIASIIIIFMRFSAKLGLSEGLGLSLILGGCIGNLIDRLRLGCVVDFLDFRVWPVFNMADSAISCGAFLLILGVALKNRTRQL